MAKTLEEKLATLPADRREKIEKRTAELTAEVRVRQARQGRPKIVSVPASSNTMIY